ncbi:MAG TPA: hypothetical protein VEZ90_02095, partial [Blastocatellia bacterium]|nr:hypothetical protein [Blastocatellia bacterium]
EIDCYRTVGRGVEDSLAVLEPPRKSSGQIRTIGIGYRPDCLAQGLIPEQDVTVREHRQL